jgi:hypothetical protein
MKQSADEHEKMRTFTEGDKVWVQDPKAVLKKQKKGKDFKYEAGRYYVVVMFVIRETSIEINNFMCFFSHYEGSTSPQLQHQVDI